MAKNFKKMIEDGLEQHGIRFDFERKSLYQVRRKTPVFRHGDISRLK